MSIWISRGKKSSAGNTLTPPDKILGVLSMSPQHPSVLREFASFPGIFDPSQPIQARPEHSREAGEPSLTSSSSLASREEQCWLPV